MTPRLVRTAGALAALWAISCQAAVGAERTRSAHVDRAAVHERTLELASGPVRLPAVLAGPHAEDRARPGPAVVLVAGSGPQDRDGTIGPNRPLRDLAWGLGGHGITTLRYDKRTLHVAGAPLQTGRLTLAEETVDDALAAVARLRRCPGVDPARVYVLGHSLGAMATPRIARRDGAIAGFIAMAGAMRPFEDALVDQLRHVASLDGTVSPHELALIRRLEAKAALVKQLTPTSSVPADELPLGAPPRFWLDLAAHPPARFLHGERRPFLVLHGERDFQTTLADWRGWQHALRDNPHAHFQRYPELNHLFMVGHGRSSPMEYERPGHVSAAVIGDISRWILRGPRCDKPDPGGEHGG